MVIELETEPCAAGVAESEKAIASKNAEETTGAPAGEASGSSAGNDVITDEDVFEDALDEEQLEQVLLSPRSCDYFSSSLRNEDQSVA